MSFYYNRKLDRWVDLRGGHATNGYHQFVMDEIELGGRAAYLIDEEDQAWWELIGNRLIEQELAQCQ